MADTTAVNAQITDAVTRSNVKVPAESPAYAMSSLYQTLAHSAGILFENAISAQQQQNVLALAASNQGVMQIYSVNTIADASARERIVQPGAADNLTSLFAALERLNAQTDASRARAMAAAPRAPEAEAGTDADTTERAAPDRSQHALKFSDDGMAESAAAIAEGVHGVVETMAEALRTMNRVTHDNLVSTLKDAALAATLAAMIRDPAKSTEYEAVLQVIQRME
jgi:hypothetical protein